MLFIKADLHFSL